MGVKTGRNAACGDRATTIDPARGRGPRDRTARRVTAAARPSALPVERYRPNSSAARGLRKGPHASSPRRRSLRRARSPLVHRDRLWPMLRAKCSPRRRSRRAPATRSRTQGRALRLAVRPPKRRHLRARLHPRLRTAGSSRRSTPRLLRLANEASPMATTRTPTWRPSRRVSAGGTTGRRAPTPRCRRTTPRTASSSSR